MLGFKWETEFKQTELSEIPREWEKSKSCDLADWINGHHRLPKKLKHWEKGATIGIADLNYEITESTQYYDGEIDPVYILNNSRTIPLLNPEIPSPEWTHPH